LLSELRLRVALRLIAYAHGWCVDVRKATYTRVTNATYLLKNTCALHAK